MASNNGHPTIKRATFRPRSPCRTNSWTPSCQTSWQWSQANGLVSEARELRWPPPPPGFKRPLIEDGRFLIHRQVSWAFRVFSSVWFFFDPGSCIAVPDSTGFLKDHWVARRSFLRPKTFGWFQREANCRTGGGSSPKKRVTVRECCDHNEGFWRVPNVLIGSPEGPSQTCSKEIHRCVSEPWPK